MRLEVEMMSKTEAGIQLLPSLMGCLDNMEEACGLIMEGQGEVSLVGCM